MSQSPDTAQPVTVTPTRVEQAGRVEQGVKLRGAEKVARIPVKVIPTVELPRKPDWIRVRISNPGEVARIKSVLREQKLHTVCEEAACPNLPECFGGGTATFMIMGDICTRRCPFCDVAHGRPNALDVDEPRHLAETIQNLRLKYVVVTSVDRDDLKDGGAQHFVDCIRESRALNPTTKMEILVPDFRGRMDIAIRLMKECPPDVFNHNIETVPRLYKAVRPGSDYQHSLTLLKRFKEECPEVSSKCGIMVGLGETKEEVLAVLDDLRAHNVELITIGQYLQPSKNHAPVDRFVTPEEFAEYAAYGKKIGFRNIWSGPMVRSSYHADLQFAGVDVGDVKSARAAQA